MKRHILCGAQVLERGFKLPLTASARVGLITNPTAITHDGTPTIEILRRKYNLTALFSPEHGVRGNLQAGVEVDEYIDEPTGITVYSAFGKGRARAEEVMTDLDCLFFDIQDIGARFYTYQYTMTDAMQVCAKAHVPLVVLDRPPMIPSVAQGNILHRENASFVGRFPTAARTGLTIGEFARYINSSESLGCELTVIPCEGASRMMFFDECDLPFVLPSPNLPSVDCALLYLGTCFFEGTNLSEGRGTTKPFEFIGAPWLDNRETVALAREYMRELDLNGILLRETYFTPIFHKYKDELCAGVQLHVTDRENCKPFETGLCLLRAIRKLHPGEFGFKDSMRNLFGSREIMEDDFELKSYLAAEAAPLNSYAEAIEPFRLYE